jgi:hypothetical protein
VSDNVGENTLSKKGKKSLYMPGKDQRLTGG